MMLVVCATVSSLLLLTVTVQVHSRPNGAPDAACSSLIPQHNVSNAQNLPGGFYIYSDLFNNNNRGAYVADRNYEGNYAHVTALMQNQMKKKH